MADKDSGDKQPWLVPVVVAVVGAISAVAVALINKPPQIPNPSSSSTALTPLSFRDWQGSWDLQWEFNGQWYGKTMTLRSDQSGIEGDYELGTLKGVFVGGDISKVTGEYINTSRTGQDCPSGKQTGLFSLNLTSGGRHMDGWWDLCGKGTRRQWKADKRD